MVLSSGHLNAIHYVLPDSFPWWGLLIIVVVALLYVFLAKRRNGRR
jgi:hypothetical protein